MRRIASFAVRIRALSLLLPLLAVPAGLGAQGDPAPAPEVEELPTAPAPLAVTTEEGDPEEGAELAELRRLLAEAEAIFNSARQPDAAPLLTALVDRLAPGGPTAAATPSGEVLRRALLLRAETSFNLGEEAAARADLAALLAFDPGARLDAAAVSPKFFALLESLRAEMVGDLVLAVSPADATVTLGERVLEAWQGAAPVLAGRYQVTVQRPGYRSLTTELVVPAADGVLLEADLERTSAVVRLTTRPGGVEVRVDGRAAGVTAEDAELLIDGLAVGSHEIELARAGYRTRRVQLEIDALADHELEPLELEPTRGTLTIRGVPAGATVRVAGEVRDA
ncbi:MAG: PEGA domain-containing protein, partial [Thermoanaerobaculia bacterium]|nr:PEGA domain-containing protein [Thermoanaerobaculia bacterium]